MWHWFFSTRPNQSRRRQSPAPTFRPLLEPLEDRSLPSTTMMPASASMAMTPASTPVASSSASTPTPAAVNTIASLSHDQVHTLQAVFTQQTEMATIQLEVEQVVLGILQPFAQQVPQIQPVIGFLNSVIPGQQATVNTLQNQTNLLNQLDDVQDQVIILDATIQNDAAMVQVQQQLGNVQAANMLQSAIVADQAAVQALQPQITAVEVEVAAVV